MRYLDLGDNRSRGTLCCCTSTHTPKYRSYMKTYSTFPLQLSSCTRDVKKRDILDDLSSLPTTQIRPQEKKGSQGRSR